MNSLMFRITTASLTFLIGVGIATAWVINKREPIIPPVATDTLTATSTSATLEMVFVLDTTGSMGGLIEGAKQGVLFLAFIPGNGSGG